MPRWHKQRDDGMISKHTDAIATLRGYRSSDQMSIPVAGVSRHRVPRYDLPSARMAALEGTNLESVNSHRLAE